MTWEVLNVIGTLAFAASGAIVAMEEEYDILGVFVLGLVTAFGGGVVRNLLIGIPTTILWEQTPLIIATLLFITFLFLLPASWIGRWKRWGILLDAAGLSAFAIQGALYATEMHRPLIAITVAAMLTGIGGGMIRDVLAGRKPLVLRDEIYALWAALGGLSIGLGLVSTTSPVQLYLLFALIIILRMVSFYFKLKLPRRSMKT